MELNRQPEKSVYKEFVPHVVNVSDIKFQGNPETLSNFPQWVWYTVAAPVLWGGLDNEVLSSIQQETEVTYHRKIFEKSIFAGFESQGNVAWNHMLWAAPQTDWPKLKAEFLGATLVDVERNLMVKFGLQELVIYDPLAIDKMSVIPPDPPTHLIYAFGVMSNQKTIAFRADQKLVEHPRVYTFKPEKDIISLYGKTLKGQQNVADVASRMEEL